MKIVKLQEVLEKRHVQDEIITQIHEGKLFVYPTDTVYGLGCDATNKKAVKKIREIKNTTHPLSVIAPSKTWITENLMVPDSRFLDTLPGPFTLILKKQKQFLQEAAASETLGVRIPDHPLTQILQETGTPIITTSCNISGEKAATTIAELPLEIKNNVDTIIDGGELDNPSSMLIDCTKKEPVILERSI